VGSNNWVFFEKNDQKVFISLFNAKVRAEDQYDYFSFHKSYKKTSFYGNSYGKFFTKKKKKLPLYIRKNHFNIKHTLFYPKSNFFKNNVGTFFYPSTSSYNFRGEVNVIPEIMYYNQMVLDNIKVFNSVQVRNSLLTSGFFSYHDDYEFKPTNKHFYKKSFSKNSTINDNFSIFKPSKQILKNLYYIVKQKRFSYKSYYRDFFFNKNSFIFKDTNHESRLSSNLFYKLYVNNKRLLRTFRLLVLPTNVNIAVTTNSFDVIHS